MNIPTSADIITAIDVRGETYFEVKGEGGAWDTREQAEAWVAKIAAKRSNPTRTATASCHYCGLPTRHGRCAECI